MQLGDRRVVLYHGVLAIASQQRRKHHTCPGITSRTRQSQTFAQLITEERGTHRCWWDVTTSVLPNRHTVCATALLSGGARTSFGTLAGLQLLRMVVSIATAAVYAELNTEVIVGRTLRFLGTEPIVW